MTPSSNGPTDVTLCPVCSGAMYEIGLIANLPMLQCRCKFISIDPRKWKNPFSDKDYYQREAMQLPQSPSPFVRHRIKELNKYLSSGLVADLGSGPGHTVIALANAGYDAVGVDESRVATDFLRTHFPGASWYHGRIDSYLQEPRIHDGFTLYHVLEHIPEPGEICRLARNRLRPGGVLVVEVPDVGSGQARLYGGRWGMYLPDHVNYFTRATLCKLLEPLGFRLLATRRKYHFAWPAGIWWKDYLHKTLGNIGMHSIISTCWRRL
jgi:SAM-dependent methyltransferase